MMKETSTYWKDLLTRLCEMKGFELKWFKLDQSCYFPGDWHCMSIAGRYPLKGTFCIRSLRSAVYPGSQTPTYITSTWVTPTTDTFDEAARKIIQVSFGNWWTGSQIKFDGKRKLLCDDYAFKFPSSESELKMILAINGF